MSTDVDVLVAAARRFSEDIAVARVFGKQGRATALQVLPRRLPQPVGQLVRRASAVRRLADLLDTAQIDRPGY